MLHISTSSGGLQRAIPVGRPPFDDRYTPYDYTGLEPFIAPNIHFISAKQVENTSIVYPNVLVYSYEDVKKLEGEKTWKTQVIMPVDIVEK